MPSDREMDKFQNIKEWNERANQGWRFKRNVDWLIAEVEKLRSQVQDYEAVLEFYGHRHRRSLIVVNDQYGARAREVLEKWQKS